MLFKGEIIRCFVKGRLRYTGKFKTLIRSIILKGDILCIISQQLLSSPICSFKAGFQVSMTLCMISFLLLTQNCQGLPKVIKMVLFMLKSTDLGCPRSNLFCFPDNRALLSCIWQYYFVSVSEIFVFSKLDPHPSYVVQVIKSRFFLTKGTLLYSSLLYPFRVRSLVTSDMHSETKGFRFESGCQLCAEMSSLQ